MTAAPPDSLYCEPTTRGAVVRARENVPHALNCGCEKRGSGTAVRGEDLQSRARPPRGGVAATPGRVPHQPRPNRRARVSISVDDPGGMRGGLGRAAGVRLASRHRRLLLLNVHKKGASHASDLYASRC